MTQRLSVAVAAAIACAALCGCKGKEAKPGETASAKRGAITRTSASGPVKATVTLSPEKPTLGDALHLLLAVRAEKNVELHMPAFGEALGRFAITSFVPRRTTAPDGATEESQEYVLEAPMSGKQKIPPLLIEFVDRRNGAAAAQPAQASDAGAAAGPGTAPAEPSELLTEELTVEVASVLDDEKSGTLRGPLGPLSESEGAGAPRRKALWIGGAVALVLLGLAVALFIQRSRRRRELGRDPLDVALDRLAALEQRGLPAPEAADGWYVEISAIVRHFVEDRYALRAPELTTEEFLARAGDSALLAPAHRVLLRSFLERCDRVKFAAWRPPESESGEVIAAARRFLEESRAPAPVSSSSGGM